MDSASAIAMIMATMLFAGIVQGAAGFGFGLVSVGLLGWIAPDVKTATILPLLANIALTGTMLAKLKSHIRIDRIGILIVGSLIAVPFGAYFLQSAPVSAIRIGLGVLLLGSAAYALHPKLSDRPWHRAYAGFPLGVFSGLLGGAFNTGGPPAIAYLTTQKLPHVEYVASLQLLFCLAAIVRLISLTSLGLMDGKLALLSTTGIAAAVGGCLIGIFILDKVPSKWMRYGVITMQVLLGLSYLIFL
ncbi:MAG: sulfite exporter TauE/SafE family protein [Planctomycetes bacterium]|nr:sulfite exporter TauE/SafE family protein [Planctomycetota bacterium]